MSKILHKLGRVTSKLQIRDFGHEKVPYLEALGLQERLWEQCKNSEIPDTLLQLQHPPVYTVGKRGTQEDFIGSAEDLENTGAEVHTIGRGGETTFHGPGQIVFYPIVNLRRLKIGARAYVEGLEDTIVHALHDFGISAKGRQPGRTGVWVNDRKIAAIGVQISAGTSRHGLALNVNNDLSYFKHIVPCGLPDFEVTSVEKETGHADLQECCKSLRQSFIRQFQYTDVFSLE